MFLPKLPSNDLQNALFTIMVFQRAIPLIKKHITANELLQLAHAQEIHSYHVYNHQEVFLKNRRIVFWNSVILPTSYSTFQDGIIFSERLCIHALNQYPICDFVSTIARFTNHGING
jgi:hypothetical protein